MSYWLGYITSRSALGYVAVAGPVSLDDALDRNCGLDIAAHYASPCIIDKKTKRIVCRWDNLERKWGELLYERN